MNDEDETHPSTRWTAACRSRPRQTLAEQLLYLPDDKSRRELEAYRLQHEAAHGATDLTQRYTSTWPIEQQRWLIEHHAKQYLEGLPPFARAYFISKMDGPVGEGRLDDVVDGYFREFLKRQLLLGRHRSDSETPAMRRPLQPT